MGGEVASAAEKRNFPGGSKERVNRAGRAIRDGSAVAEDYIVIELWRAAHRQVLNTFQSILRNRTHGTGVIVAQRHKRRNTIFGKLRRLPKMELARMDDVAGCRLIFDDIAELREFRKNMHKARFNHILRNDPEKYDYIQSPKTTGYRGIHDVYAYDVNSPTGRDLKGLLIELQYRTFFQHAWATAVEVVGFVSESQPKFQAGDKRYEVVLSFASEIIARAFEDSTSCHPDVPNQELVEEFIKLDEQLGLMRMLRALDTSKQEISDKQHVILIFRENNADANAKPHLETRSFEHATDALAELFALEKSEPKADVVLVRANSSDAVRTAFRNYFSDAREFIRLIDEGCARLQDKFVVHSWPDENEIRLDLDILR